jgi:hypothetical protein
MALPKLFLILFTAYYVGAGLGTFLKFSEQAKPGDFLKILFIVPFQTLVLAAVIFMDVLPEVMKACRGPKNRGWIAPMRNIRIFFACAYTCLSSMPIFAGRLAYVQIQAKQEKHVMLKSRKDFGLYLEKTLCQQV